MISKTALRQRPFDIKAALSKMGYGYYFANPFRGDISKDPKHAYSSVWDCYDKMLAWDGELAAIDGLYRVAVLSHDTTVEPADELPESARAAEWMRAVLARITNLTDVLDGLLDGIAKGLGIALLGPDGYDDEIDGKLSPPSIEVLPQHWFSFQLADNNVHQLVYNGTYGGKKNQVIDPSRLIVLRQGQTLENPYGYGYLRKCFWHFVVKNFLSGYMQELFEYAVEPQMWAEISAEQPDVWDLRDNIIAEMENMGRRTSSVMPPGVKINVIPADATAVNAEMLAIRYYCDLQAKIVLGQTLTTDVGRTGSYELGKIHELQQARYVVAGCRRLERAFNKQFVEPLCQLNFGAGRAKWRILYEPQRDVAGVVDAVVKLAQRYNLKVTADWLYKLLDIPLPEDLPPETVLEPTTTSTSNGYEGFMPVLSSKPVALVSPARKRAARERDGLINRQVKSAIAKSRSAVEGRLNFFQKTINGAAGYDSARRRLEEREKSWDAFGDLLRRAVVTQYALGTAMAAMATTARKTKGTTLAAAEFDTWEDVVRTFSKKVPLPAGEFYALDISLRNKYWTAARVEDELIVKRLLEAMATAEAGGETFADFRRNANAVFTSLGYMPEDPYRLETVFRTNLAISDAAARDDWCRRPEVAEMIQGYEYVTAGDDLVRPEHAALEGTTLPADDPFWDSNSPPLDFNCRCDKVMVLVGEPFREHGAPEEIKTADGRIINWRDVPNAKYGFDRRPIDMLRAEYE